MQRLIESRQQQPLVSWHFPPDVRDALAYAATLPEEIRLTTIERIISEARAKYPDRFRPEQP